MSISHAIPTPGQPGAVTRQVTFAGCVLATGEVNGYDDSDFYALVLDRGAKAIRRVTYASTRYASDGCSARVDATPAVLAEAGRILKLAAFRRWRRAMERDARTVQVGRDVRVVKGRAVPVGTVGRVVRVTLSPHARGARFGRHAGSIAATPGDYRVQIVTPEGTAHWTSAANVAVCDPAQYEEPARRGRDLAARAVADGAWGLAERDDA